MQKVNSSLWKGIGLMTLSWTCFAIVGALVKYTYRYTTTEVTFFFQNFGAFLFVSSLFLRPGFPLFSSRNWSLLIARATLGAFAFYCYFFSFSFIPLTDATLLNTTAPLFLPVILYLWLKKKSSGRVWISSAVGFLGVMLILKPSSEIFQFGAIPALLSGVGSAMVMLIIRQMRSESPKRIVLVYLLIAALLSFPFAAPSIPSLPLAAWPPLILIGILFGFAQITYTRSLSFAETTVLAPFTYISVVVAGCLEWAVWGRVPSLWSVVGMAFVILGGILTIVWSRAAPANQVIEAK